MVRDDDGNYRGVKAGHFNYTNRLAVGVIQYKDAWKLMINYVVVEDILLSTIEVLLKERERVHLTLYSWIMTSQSSAHK